MTAIPSPMPALCIKTTAATARTTAVTNEKIKILFEMSGKDAKHFVRYFDHKICDTDSPRRYDIYILMEYLKPLDKQIREKDFCVKDVINLGLEVLQGLKTCHDNNVIHRDIKENNIFVSESGEYKIGDFGVSKVLKNGSKAESVKGTPNYLAPEVYSGDGEYTKTVDLYSLGIVLYRLLNYNRNPFLPPYPQRYDDKDRENAFKRRITGETPPPPLLGGEEIGKVIIKAISNSSERFQTADDFIYALKRAVDNTPLEIVNQKIRSAKHQDPDDFTKYDTPPEVDLSEDDKENCSNSLNRLLFDTENEDIKPKPKLEPKPEPEPEPEPKPEPEPEPKPKPEPEPDPKPKPEPVRESNRKIWVIIRIILILLVAAVIIGILLMNYFRENESIHENQIMEEQKQETDAEGATALQSAIQQKDFVTAYSLIQNSVQNGENLDKEIQSFVHACEEELEYKRAVAGMKLLSDNISNNEAFYRETIQWFYGREQEDLARQILSDLREKGSEGVNLADSISLDNNLTQPNESS